MLHELLLVIALNALHVEEADRLPGRGRARRRAGPGAVRPPAAGRSRGDRHRTLWHGVRLGTSSGSGTAQSQDRLRWQTAQSQAGSDSRLVQSQTSSDGGLLSLRPAPMADWSSSDQLRWRTAQSLQTSSDWRSEALQYPSHQTHTAYRLGLDSVWVESRPFCLCLLGPDRSQRRSPLWPVNPVYSYLPNVIKVQ